MEIEFTKILPQKVMQKKILISYLNQLCLLDYGKEAEEFNFSSNNIDELKGIIKNHSNGLISSTYKHWVMYDENSSRESLIIYAQNSIFLEKSNIAYFSLLDFRQVSFINSFKEFLLEKI